ncbi:cupin domain-containing protein [Variovorax terrae]|uniref:Cupin domain-containing protein n=1 Tax=Variovorax terrae TaxID=2923278 RepID=A0A9X1VVP3_9BURK|nr:cupin domain-containing protein [Variovorax terrae]MCJ0764125.1 cupin domain-containing protein [Variovorax terrae]
MQVANPADSEVRTDDHPTGVLGFRYLLRGAENTPENFVMLIAENLGHFQMVRHRHNFDQFRYVISGQMNLGDGDVLRAGELCYFPEGTPYGPQDDGAGPVVLTMQFGGSNGYGYMSPDQYLAGREALGRAGRFEGPVYLREGADGRTTKKFSINAIWEQAMGARMLIPAPRYSRPILMNPRAYRWTPVPQQRGVQRKLLGAFSERGVVADIHRIPAGATLRLLPEQAIRLFFVLEGEGRFGAEALGQHFGAQLDAGEACEVTAAQELLLLGFALPLLDADWDHSDLEAVEPTPDESVTADTH